MEDEQKQFLEMAYSIGVRLCRDAIWSGKKCNWVGPSMEYISKTWKIVQRAYGTDVYSGTSGLGYFLSHLYAYTNDPIIKKTAVGCFEHTIANADQIPAAARIGFYTGWSGIIKALQSCAVLLHTEAFETKASLMLDSLHQCNLQESGLDVLAGSAGAIPVLISQHSRKSDAAMSTAKKIADHLISVAQKTDNGWSWNTLNPQSTYARNNLLGFSHGTAGIAWAFIELYNIAREEKYYDAAQNAFAYERSLFSAEYANWPDLRDADKKNGAMLYGSVAWCHGAPGIGLSRVRAYDILADETCKKEADIAVSTTSAMISQSLQGGQSNFSLCHGIAGNTELLMIAGASFKKQELIDYAQYTGQAGINFFTNNSFTWTCGITGAGEAPGLMLGLAGIGFFYLRLYDAAAIPSILLPVPV